MKKQLFRLCSALLLAALVISQANMPIEGKSKVLYYISNLNKTKGNTEYRSPGINKIVFESDKVTLYASLSKSTKPLAPSSEGQWCRYKKRTFKLAKNIKYYGVGGDNPRCTYDADTFKEICLSYNGLGLEIKLKNNKVVSMTLMS